MATPDSLTRRSLLVGAAAAAGTGLAARSAVAGEGGDFGRAPQRGAAGRPALDRLARRRGLVFGTAMSTRLLRDDGYRRLVDRQAGIILTEDDLLWYRLRPGPREPLDFSYADRLVDRATRHGQQVLGAHLVWDEGFGDGWSDEALWGMSRRRAERVLYGTARASVRRYRGRMAGWVVANEVTAPGGVRGLRTDVPWYETIGPAYVGECFRIAHEEDPQAVLVLNEYGFETIGERGESPVARQRATLQVLDDLLADGVPVHALGVQAHLFADCFAERFDARAYRDFLARVAERGLDVLVTELDVLDDGLPPDPPRRDRAVADAYARYLDVTLREPAVKAVLAFGLSDRHTWLEEDYPRTDGAPRRPLLFDRRLRPKPAARAVRRSLRGAARRCPLGGA